MSGKNGANSFPLHKDDSVYQIVAKWDDTWQQDIIWQCRVDVIRTAGDSYHVEMWDQAYDLKLAQGDKGLHNDGDTLLLEPTDWKRYPKLTIIRRGEFGDGGPQGSKVEFVAMHTSDGNTPFYDFRWDTESTGWDSRYKKVEDSDKGRYCDVPDIDNSGENGPRQKITCYYPCTYL
jgi:hypothetical protein